MAQSTFPDGQAAIAERNALFNRYLSVTVGALRWESIRATFKVRKSYRKNPNPAEVVLYNLSDHARNGVVNRGTQVVVNAGYVGNSGTLYTGQIVGVDHKREGTEWISTLTLRDGDAAWLSYSSRSYATGTPRLTIVSALAADMGYTLNSDAQALISTYGSTRTGIVTHGHSYAEMDDQLRPLGLAWSIQDGQLQIVTAGGGTTESAILLTPRTGLLYVPERMEQYHKPNSKKKGKPFQIKVKSLLQTGIRPGRQVRVESDEFTGDYICLTVEHHGDTHGNDWISECELQEVYGG